MQGKIKKLITHRGYGFINADDEEEEDIFFHLSQLDAVKFNELREGDIVEFEIEETEKGPQAVGVEIIEKVEAEPSELGFGI